MVIVILVDFPTLFTGSLCTCSLNWTFFRLIFASDTRLDSIVVASTTKNSARALLMADDKIALGPGGKGRMRINQEIFEITSMHQIRRREKLFICLPLNMFAYGCHQHERLPRVAPAG